MKKWACLLAFPYMVARSSDTLIYENGKFQDYYYVDKMSCGDKEQCEDLAAALNEAHERKMGENNPAPWREKVNGVLDKETDRL